MPIANAVLVYEAGGSGLASSFRSPRVDAARQAVLTTQTTPPQVIECFINHKKQYSSF